MGYSTETAEPGGAWLSALGGRLLVPVVIATRVLCYDVLPAALAWLVSSAGGFDLFSSFNNPALRRLEGLGLFLSVVGAIITAESVTHMGRPFSVSHFLVTAVVMGVALFPSLAEWHRVRIGLTLEQFALVQTYCYLALKVTVGILIGATVSWILLARYARIASAPSHQYSRK